MFRDCAQMPVMPSYPVQFMDLTAQAGCPQMPGTVFRLSIPPGAEINLLNLVEVSSPNGICLIVRLPILGGSMGPINALMQSIRQMGGLAQQMPSQFYPGY